MTDETTNIHPEPEPLPEPPYGPQPQPRKSRKVLALGLAAVFVGVVVGGGVGYAVLKSEQNETKPAAAKPWKAPTPTKTGEYGTQSGGSHYGTLGKLLLPVPDAYSPGPDIAEYGNDAELSGKQAVALMKESYGHLTAKQRKAARAAVDRLHIEGIGMRTYGYQGGDFVVDMQLVQMKNKQAARSYTEYFNAYTKALGIFRNGPKISGHDKARCVLPPKVPGAALDTMTCQATEGDLMISMTVTGPSPLDKNTAAELFKQQLDRVQDPGEAV